MRFFLPALASLSLICPVLVQSASAQTQPSHTTPLQNRSESRALVQKLIREGKIMRPSEAKRGMKGYALSVFQGTKIERFELEVLGNLEKSQGGGDLVMIKVLTGPVVKRQSGIIQGMSGSPVYINGKLLGAIAIGFGFPKEPIGGVTPITQMIETGLPDNSVPPKPVKMAKVDNSYHAQTPFEVADRKINRVLISSNPKTPDFTDASTMTMRPCTRLVMLSGVSAQGLERWKKTFAPYGITPVIGGGAMGGSSRQVFGIPSRKTGVKADLSPGAAIGVQMASGDMDATGVGTVTFRDGNRVLAFGHPMFNLGGVSMPMTTAFVHDIFPSYDVSFKMASPIETVGELQRDNNYSVGGTVGRVAQTIPMRLRIVDADKKIDRKINVRLIKDPLFTPELLQNIAVEAVQTTIGLDSAKTVKVDLGIGLSNGPTIRRQNTTYAGEAVIQGALGELLDAVSITQQNPFDKGSLKSVDLTVNVISGRKTARIRRIFADRNRIKAGEKVTVSVVLEPSNQPDVSVTRRFVIPVPADTPKGVLRVAVSPAESYWAGRSRVGGAPPRPGTLRELLDAYAKIGASNSLLLQASTPRSYLLLDRKKVANPPSLWNRLVPLAGSTSLGTFNETVEMREPSEYVLSGLESISIPVDSRRYSDQTSPEVPSSDSSSGSISTPVAVPDNSADEAEDAPDEAVELTSKLDYRGRNMNWMSKLNLQPGFNLATSKTKATTPAIVPARTAEPTTTPTPTGTPTPTPSPTPDASASSIARPVGRWVQKTSTDFRHGEFKNALVRDDGTIIGGPNTKLLVSSGEPVAWSVTADGSTTYVGTGYSARLIKVQNGHSKVIYEGPEVAITALTNDGHGNVYAGASPGGRVYRFAPDGTKTTVLQTSETFINALAWQGDTLIAATGGERGALYKVESPRTATALQTASKPFVVLGQKHVKALSVLGDTIYAGTSADAVLYRIDRSGAATAIYQPGGNVQSSVVNAPSNNPSSPTTVIVINSSGGSQPNPLLSDMPSPAGSVSGGGNEILSVCAVEGKDGAPATVYFGTLASGSVWSYTPQRGVAEAWKSSGRSIYALGKDEAGNLIVGCDGGEVWRLSFPDGDTQASRLLDANQPQVLALDVSGGKILAATANNAAVYEISTQKDAKPSFLSNVFDAGQIVRFGSLRSNGTSYTIETRSGNTLEPDETWTAFAALKDGQVASPPARFLQYRATLEEGGMLNRIEVLYRTPNRAPKVNWALTAAQDYISGKKNLTWTATDPDSDTLRSTVEIARADTKERNWKPVELKTITASTTELDSTKFDDGIYVLRVTVSDAARNADDPKRDVSISSPVVIDNTAPVLAALTAEKTPEGWTIRAEASDVTSPIAGAEWRVLPAEAPKPATTTATTAKPADTKTPAPVASATPTPSPVVTPPPVTPANGTILWQAFSATDGIFDGKKEAIIALADNAIPGVTVEKGTKIEVRLRDAAGNQSTSTLVLP